jgi:hypothetical protein
MVFCLGELVEDLPIELRQMPRVHITATISTPTYSSTTSPSFATYSTATCPSFATCSATTRS